ncbi:MAG: hypothetical protein IJM11_07695, partial [Firmicutes bacterium]|nr:hypothetical protein [Bacillota bacterium]
MMDGRKKKGIKECLKRLAAAGRIRRTASLLLVFAVLLSAVPAEAFAIDWFPVNKTQDAAAAAPTPTTNTYILEVSSGSRAKGTIADNVLYFVVSYTTGSGSTAVSRSAIIMPNVDGISDGIDKAEQYGSRSSRKSIAASGFGYAPAGDAEGYKALGSVQTDQFLFTTPEEITSITGIQIFGKRSKTSSQWICQAMRIYEVSAVYGLDMYGWFSNLPYIDFEGSVFAELQLGAGAGIFNWETSGGMYNLKAYGAGGFAGAVVVDRTSRQAYEAATGQTTHIDQAHSTQTTKKVVIRLDLADTGGAGFESLAGSYAAGSMSKVSDLGFCETAALQIRYVDIFGASRDVVLPLAINSLGPIMEEMGDIAIAGFAQQGDSLAVPAMLPDYREITSIGIILGESSAAAEAGLAEVPVSRSSAAETEREARKVLSESDSISYTCIAVYDAATASAGLDGATVRTSYVAGDNNPVKYSTATSTEGISIDAAPGSNSYKYFSLQPYSEYLVLKPVDRLERYLVTISTDNVGNAGTESDLKIQFSYISIKDKEIVSPAYDVREYVRMFYGEWPGNVDDFAYKYGLRQGGTVQFIVPLQGVKQFTGVGFKLEGGDEWQFSGVSIAMVKPSEERASYVDSRVAQWEEISSTELVPNTSQPKYLSHVRYSRAVTTKDVCFSIGTTYAPTETVPVPGEDWVPGTLIQDDGTTVEFNGQGSEVSKKDEIDWDSVRRSMTYEQTKQDFGFTKERGSYLVTVKVKGDLVNPSHEDDDAGSKNLFYFQLIFEHGKSGCTLANQQIQGDAFRTGDECQFRIPASQDYGDLV